MANTSLQTLISKIRDEIKLDRLGKIWSNEEILDAVKESLIEIQDKGSYNWIENQGEISFNSVLGQEKYLLSDIDINLRQIDVVIYGTNILQSKRLLDIKNMYSTVPNGTPSYYYIYNGFIGLVPISDVSTIVNLLYTKSVGMFVKEDDLSPFGVDFDNAIILYAAYTLLNKPADNANINRGQVKLKRFQKVIGNLIKRYLLIDGGNMIYKSNYTSRITRGARHTKFIHLG